MTKSGPALIAGSAHPHLAGSIADLLGVSPVDCAVDRFPDGETGVEVREPLQGRPVVIVQPTSPPVNDHLVELLALVDACRRAAAKKITVVLPYYGYARSDRRHGHGEPITASMVATLVQAVGADHVVTVDLHTPQIEGFFRIPVEEVTAVPVLCDAVEREAPADAVVVAPDAGRVKLATFYAERLGRPLVLLHKQRVSGRETEVTRIVGEVQGRACLLVDDMISTGGTLVKSAAALRAAGATAIVAAATHGLLLDGATDRLVEAGIEQIFVTDTVSLPTNGSALRAVSVAGLIAETLRRYGPGA